MNESNKLATSHPQKVLCELRNSFAFVAHCIHIHMYINIYIVKMCIILCIICTRRIVRRGDCEKKRQRVCLLPLNSLVVLVVLKLIDFSCSKCVFLCPFTVDRTVLRSNAGRLLVIATPHKAYSKRSEERQSFLENFEIFKISFCCIREKYTKVQSVFCLSTVRVHQQQYE